MTEHKREECITVVTSAIETEIRKCIANNKRLKKTLEFVGQVDAISEHRLLSFYVKFIETPTYRNWYDGMFFRCWETLVELSKKLPKMKFEYYACPKDGDINSDIYEGFMISLVK